jgi:hypothetical protein
VTLVVNFEGNIIHFSRTAHSEVGFPTLKLFSNGEQHS